MANESRSGSETGAELLSGIILIIVAGIMLGVGFNALQRTAESERGLAWIKQEIKIASLEELQQDNPGTSTERVGGADEPVSETAADDPAPASGSSATSNRSNEAPEQRDTANDGGHATADGTSATPARGDTTPAASATESSPPAPQADLPFIPDVQEPLEVQYAAVKKFHDAGAAVFVDARSREEYEEGHIPGARHLSADDLFEDPTLADRLDTQGKPIITYCSSADCNLARDLAFALIESGHRKVLVYRDGTMGWKAEGQPLAPSTAPDGSAP